MEVVEYLRSAAYNHHKEVRAPFGAGANRIGFISTAIIIPQAAV